MKMSKIIATVALTVATTAVMAAPINANKVTKTTTVAYKCQQGKKLTVKYGFNAAGIPVTATTKIAGKNRVMQYDQRTSDNVSTNFNNAQGFKLGAEAFELNNVRKASISTITNGQNVIAFKGCSPR